MELDTDQQQVQDVVTQGYNLQNTFVEDQTNNLKDMLSNWFWNWMEISNSGNNHNEFFFFIILVSTIRQLVGRMELVTLHHGMSNSIFSRCKILACRQQRFPCKRRSVYPEHLAAHVFLMRSACQIVIVTHFTSCLAQVQDEALCVVQNSSHHRAARRAPHLWWVVNFHMALAFLPSQWHDLP